MKISFLLIMMVFVSEAGISQTNYHGQIFEVDSRQPIPLVDIADINNHSITNSDAEGKFTITAKIGDILTFNLPLYQRDTVLVTNKSELKINLKKKSDTLKEVKINSSRIDFVFHNTDLKTQELLKGSSILYQIDESGNYIGGLKLMLDDSKRYHSDKNKQQKLNLEELRQNEISKAFSINNIKQYLPIKDQELENFIILYRPEIKVFFRSNFVLADYLSMCYKAFNKIPAEKRQSKEFLAINQ